MHNINWRDRQVLVTGADGFIGSHLAERLVREGARVRAFVLYNSFSSCGCLEDSPLRHEMEIFPGDVRDAERVAEAMRGCEVVFHLAALISVPYSYQAPESFVDTNIRGTLNVLDAARCPPPAGFTAPRSRCQSVRPTSCRNSHLRCLQDCSRQVS